jgi:hypothetical protein
VRGAATAGTYNFYGTVGAVMTANGAVANVVQNIGADQQRALLEALDIVRKALEVAPQVPARDRTELIELADEAVSEVKRERPNTRRLTQVLQNLAGAVQGIASGGPAYEAIRAAAAAIGIPI